MKEELKKYRECQVVSSAGWRFDTSDINYGEYDDGIVTARVIMDGAGTWMSPCHVWMSRMRVEAKDTAADISQERIELIRDRIRRALKVLKIKYREQ